MAASPESDDRDPLPKLTRLLDDQGIVAALRFLNRRAPHRFTAIYRYELAMLRNLYLIDAFNPAVERGEDVAAEDAYCGLLVPHGGSLVFGNARGDASLALKNGSPVVSYCGVLLLTSRGRPFGSLCHFDVKPCDHAAGEMPILESVAPLIMAQIAACPASS